MGVGRVREDEPGGVFIGDGRGGAPRLWLSGYHRPYPEQWEPDGVDTVVFTVRVQAAGLSAEAPVTTWNGDGLDDFLGRLAEDFRGWEGERTWRSLQADLELGATHRSGGHVALAWTLSPHAWDGDYWQARLTTVVEAGEEMRRLAEDVRDFLRPG